MKFPHFRLSEIFLSLCFRSTVWKLCAISITQILREINFGDSRSAKSAILTHLEAANFDFYEIKQFLKLIFTKLTKFMTSIKAKTAVLELVDFPKLISRKI